MWRKYFFILLGSFFITNISAQYYFVSQPDIEENGIVLNNLGEEVFRTEEGWYPIGNTNKVFQINRFPFCFSKRKYREQTQFAMLTEDMEWVLLDDFDDVERLTHGISRGRINGVGYFVISPNGLSKQDTFTSIGFYNKEGFAVATKKSSPNSGITRYGLIDKTGNWHWPPIYQKIRDLHENRYAVQDTFQQISIQSTQGDLILPFGFDDWTVEHNTFFDETGHIFVRMPDQSYGIMNKEGQLVADGIPYKQNDFINGISAIKIDDWHQFMNTNGEIISADSFRYVQSFSYNRGLVEDQQTTCLGYLDQSGNWAISPQYTFAARYEYGLAVVAPANGNCEERKRVYTPRNGTQGFIMGNNYPTYYEVIDTNGVVLWADSCDRVRVIGAHTIFVKSKYHNLIPAYQIIQLGEQNRTIWTNRDFTLSEWHQLDNVDLNDLRRVHFGLGTGVFYPRGTQSYINPLPAGFFDKINQMPKLEVLKLEAKEVQQHLGTIFELRELKTLSLKHCALTTIPPTIRHLNALEELDLSENNLTALPKAIFRMKHLSILNIKGNDFPSDLIPQLMKALPNTKVIYKRRE